MSEMPIELGRVAREELDGSVSAEAHRRGRERALRAFAKETFSPRRRRVQRAWIGFAAAAALVIALAVFLWPTPRLTFDVEGGAITRTASGAHVHVSEAPSRAIFSDGSRVVFEPGATGRIDDLTEHGARVILASGSVTMDIAHREGTTWSLEAGPYVVRVTGTEFRTSWDPVAGSFDVVMASGSVRVEAPNVPNGVSVEGGYALMVRGDGALSIVRSADATAESGESAATTAQAPTANASARVGPPTTAPSSGWEVVPPNPTASSASAASSTTSTASATASGPAAQSWTELVSEGRYADVVAAARGRGIPSVVESAPLADLVALSDAARYERDGTIARAVLEAQRKRFGSTAAGRAATFLLGRLAEDSDKDLSKAITLYDEYLSSGGPYSHEALGRKMVAVRKLSGDAAARPIAAAYLAKYPEGGYAAVARSITEAP